jgi:hypothetical protein
MGGVGCRRDGPQEARVCVDAGGDDIFFPAVVDTAADRHLRGDTVCIHFSECVRQRGHHQRPHRHAGGAPGACCAAPQHPQSQPSISPPRESQRKAAVAEGDHM